jgi:hypothetical protein
MASSLVVLTTQARAPDDPLPRRRGNPRMRAISSSAAVRPARMKSRNCVAADRSAPGRHPARPENMLLVLDRVENVTRQQDALLGEGETPRAR